MPQLVAAAQCGFAIPETLYSNDPDEIRRFWSEHREAGVIFKLHLQTHWHAQSSGERHALFTTELRQENLQDDAPLAGCPAIYQRKVEKAYELRVTCMDERCVAIRLDSQSRDSTRLDWRSDMVAPLKPALVTLPRTVEQRCNAPMRKLGLAVGCIDLIVTPEREHIFLEVNEMGQFLWVEQDEPRSELLCCFATLLLNQRLGPSTRLVGDERLSKRELSRFWRVGARLRRGRREPCQVFSTGHHQRASTGLYGRLRVFIFDAPPPRPPPPDAPSTLSPASRARKSGQQTVLNTGGRK